MEELRKEKKVIWSPQPKQIEFMQRPEYEAFYGGAAGGGKSDSLLMEALRQVNIPHYNGAYHPKDIPQELSELIDKSLRFYGAAFPKAKYNGERTRLEISERRKDLLWEPTSCEGQNQIPREGI